MLNSLFIDIANAVLNNSGLLRMVFKSQYCPIYPGLSNTNINLEAAKNAQVLSGSIAQRQIFSLVIKFSQDITFKSFKCINSQVMLLKQLLMPVVELVGTTIPTGSLAVSYIALLSLDVMDLGEKIKEKDLY